MVRLRSLECVSRFPRTLGAASPRSHRMSRHVSPGRQGVHALGTLLIAIGLISFLSVFVTVAGVVGGGSAFGDSPSFMPAVIGMILMIAGGALRSIGAKGIHGSGLVLDPQRARRELEPHSRQVGGMIGDALDEAGIGVGAREPQPVERVVMIRCTTCQTLNDDGSKFCQECGAKL
jgi:hypothetical protein